MIIISTYRGREVEGIHIPSILTQIISPNIRKVVISVSIDATNNLDVLGWSTIDRILERPNYARLQKLEISGVRSELEEGTRTWIKGRLVHEGSSKVHDDVRSVSCVDTTCSDNFLADALKSLVC